MTNSMPPSLRAPKKASSFKRFLLIILILGLVGGAVWYFFLAPEQGSNESQQQHAHQEGGRQGSGRGSRGYNPNMPSPVAIVAVHKGDIDVTRRALGTVTPLATVTVRTQVNGQLMEIAFQEGQIVQQGDFLAQIDPRPFQNSLEQANGALERDQALLKDAKLNFERYEKLLKQDSISKQQTDTQASLVQQYEGDVLADQSQIDAAKLNLIYAHITAPVSGRVGLRQVDQGNFVQTSDTNGIVTLTQLQPITVIFTLPEDDLPSVMKLYNAGEELTATAYDRTQSTKLALGKVSAVDNQIDTSTGTVKLRAQFDNQDNSLFPNQFVNIDLKVATLHDATLAPVAAIQRGTPGTFVYRLKDDNTVAVQVVKLGPSQGNDVAVLEGLEPGDKVVTEGVDKIRDGAKVSVKSEDGVAKDKNKEGAPKDKGGDTPAPAKSETK